jgi:acyl-CoA thioesterase
VDALTFFDLRRTSDPNRWRLPVVQGLISGTGALFGGCGLGACIEVMEQVTGRPCVWATAQYLAFARPPEVIDLEVKEVVRGHRISQARVIAHVGDTEILTVVAALGERTMPFEGQWAIRPEVPRPEDCPPRVLTQHHEGTINERLEGRLADARSMDEFPGPPGTGNSALWIRLPELEMSSAALAIVGDFVPFGMSQALGQRAGGNSLDNTLRIARRVPTEWVLADVRVHAIADGFGHGLVHLWADDGTLLGTASQSTILRAWRGPHPLTELEGDVLQPEPASGSAPTDAKETR